MTGFAGMIFRDKRTIPPELAGRLASSLEPRGIFPVFRGPSCILTAEMAGAPTLGDGTGDLVVAADARIDNRRELEALLGHAQGPPLSVPELIGALYRRFGVQCPAHLLGDFAFLIWDARHRRLFGARDHFGVRPFYYHLSSVWFAAATSIASLEKLGVGMAVDETGMADFVAGAFADPAITLYRNIRRLPPAHRIIVEPDSVRIDRYWQLEAGNAPPPSDPGEAFRHIFDEAVRCRMQDARPGVMLSGGLDSSSIAGTAMGLAAGTEKHRPLPSFSLTFDGTDGWNERPFIQSMLASGPFTPHFLPSDDHDPLAAMDMMLREQDGPFLAYNHSVSRHLYAAARTAGVSVLLDGHGGDEVVSHGFGRLNELAMDRRWREMWQEAAGVAALFGSTTRQIASPYFDHNRGIRAIRRYWRSFRRRGQGAGGQACLNTALVARDLAQRTGVEERQRAVQPSRSAYQTEQDRHIEMLTSPQQGYTFEVLDRAAAAAGVTSRFPFYDRRLVEYCLSLPSSEKLSGGMTRAVLRKAMKGVLPEDVRLRRDKYDFTHQLATGLSRHADRLLELVRSDAGQMSRFLDLDTARAALERLKHPRGIGSDQLFPAWRTAVLIHWLQMQPRTLLSPPSIIRAA